MNKTLKLLIISDILIFSGFGLIGPIFAIFINDNITGGSIFTAGIASTIFMITHSLLQIWFAYAFNPKDRYWMLITGTAIAAIVPFGYIFSTHIWHVFLIQFIYGVGASFAYPSWSSLFTSNLEKGRRGFQWSIYSSGVGLGTAITAAAGGWLAEKINFELVFILTGILAVVGFLVLLGLEKKALLKRI
jgi:DHA1 family quinolone resistance protein-like MFS transporter